MDEDVWAIQVYSRARTTLEEHVLNRLILSRTIHFPLQSTSICGVLTLTIRNSRTRNGRASSRRIRRWVQAAARLTCSDLTLDSTREPPDAGQDNTQRLDFIYGPFPGQRPLTWCNELTELLAFILPMENTRMDYSRRICGIYTHPNAAIVVVLELLYWFIYGRERAQLDYDHLSTFEPSNRLTSPTVLSSEPDAVHLNIMLARGPGSASYANSLSTFPEPVPTMIKLTGSEMITCHHTTITGPGNFLHANLSAVSNMPGVIPVAVNGGSYLCCNQTVGDNPLAPCILTMLLRARSDHLRASGVPVTGGFIRPISSNHLTFPTEVNVVTFVSKLAKDDYASHTRPIDPGNTFIVAVGTFCPLYRPDGPPYGYDSSPLTVRKLTRVLQQWTQDLSQACYVRAMRPQVRCSIQEILTELVSPLGALIDINDLPDPVSHGLRNRTQEELERGIRTKFLNVTTDQVFLLVQNETGTLLETGESVGIIEHLINLCTKYEVACSLLGKCCAEPNLHIISSTSNPVAVTYDTADIMLTIPLDYDHGHTGSLDVAAPRPSREDGAVNWTSLNMRQVWSDIITHPAVESKEYIITHTRRVANGRVVQQPGCGPFDFPVADHSLVSLNSIHNTKSWISDLRVLTTSEMVNRVMSDPDTWFCDPSESEVPILECVASAIGEQHYKVKEDLFLGSTYGLVEALLNLNTCPGIKLERTIITCSITCSQADMARPELYDAIAECKNMCTMIGCTFMCDMAAKNPRNCDINTPLIVFSAKCIVNVPWRGRIGPNLKEPHNTLLWLPVHNQPTLAGSIFKTFHPHVPLHNLPQIPITTLFKLLSNTQKLFEAGKILSIHDVSDGGLLTCVAEMAMSGGKSVVITLPDHVVNPKAMLLSETPGYVIEVFRNDADSILKFLQENECAAMPIGHVVPLTESSTIAVFHKSENLLSVPFFNVVGRWRRRHIDESTLLCTHLGPHKSIYSVEYGHNQFNFPGVSRNFLTSPVRSFRAPPHAQKHVCVVEFNGQTSLEGTLFMLQYAGFVPEVVHSSSLHDFETSLDRFCGIVFTGSMCTLHEHGGVMAVATRFTESHTVVSKLSAFCRRPDTFMLGFDQLGMQILLNLNILNITADKTMYDCKIDPLQSMPLKKNASGTFESRWLNFYIPDSNSLFFKPIQENVFPSWIQGSNLGLSLDQHQESFWRNTRQICTYYQTEQPTPRIAAINYPRNPVAGCPVAGICSLDGRITGCLIDPAESFFPWTWQFVPGNRTLASTPWQLCFQQLLIWTLSTSNL
ncbi:protein G75B [Wood mouse herpesvirus]|uniref:Protein G75B n=1 Tax=Wood mouse herpesvirus TaxID=432370 RepID=D0U1R5_9GAMA|nr:protein G75B [Wood mouse herpesvirus]ACY41145.1 protein G75B [Wood mouse herpesvirus]